MALTTVEWRQALDNIPEPTGTRVLRSLGLQGKSKKTPQLVRARVPRMQAGQLHFLTWILCSTPIESLRDVVFEAEAQASSMWQPWSEANPGPERPDDTGSDHDPEDPEVNLVDALRTGALGRWSQQWSAGIVRLSLEALWDAGFVDYDGREELMALLDDPDQLAATLPAPAPPEGNATGFEGGPPAEPPPVRDEPALPSELSLLLARALDVATSPSSSTAEVERQIGGLEWLIDLDPGGLRSWFEYGRLLATVCRTMTPGRQPRGHDARLQFLAGQLQGLAEADDAADDLVRFTREHPDVAEAVLRGAVPAAPSPAEVQDRLLHAHLGAPRDAARLLLLLDEPFAGWRYFVRRARASAAALLSDGHGADADILLRAVEDRLLRWAVGSDAGVATFHAEGVATTVMRASCRRRLRNFAGASRLLLEADLEVLDDEGQVEAAVEWAMVSAELSGLDEIGFPPEDQRAHMIQRLQRAQSYLDGVLERDPANLEASLVLGVLSSCRGDDIGAARHLGTVANRLAEKPEWRDLELAVAFNRSLAQIRLLEVGTDEGAYHEMVRALDGGYVPSEQDLVSAATALEAHRSPHAADFLGRAVRLAPVAAPVVGLVIERARLGDHTAAAIAEEMAGDDRRRVVERFELLDAALAGAEIRVDAAAADRLVGQLDDVVARANRPALDERWADALGGAQTLRSVVEPAHADVMRMEVLRRSGRIEEARGIATGLFYRAAAGSLSSFDPFELLEVLRELGTPPPELANLERAVHDEPRTEISPDREPKLVLFVGGNEVQQRYRPHIQAMLDERYGGRLKVQWFFPGWSHNWTPVAEAIDASYRVRNPDAVVLMAFVRTHLGRWVRRTAGEHGLPWVACTGHGEASMTRAIERAARVAWELD